MSGRHRMLVAGAAGFVTSACAAVLATAAIAQADDPLQDRALEVVNRATRRVQATHASCRNRSPVGAPRLVDGGAGPLVAAHLGVFRRPPTPEEQAFAQLQAQGVTGIRPVGDSGVPRDGVRIVRAIDGRGVALTALREVPPIGPSRATYDRCQALVAVEVERVGRTVRPPIAAAARRLARRLRRNGRPPAERGRGEGLLATLLGPDDTALGGGGIAPFDPTSFTRAGIATSTAVPGVGSRLTLVVPDGVARIDATFPREGSVRGRRYRATVQRTFVVRDNVVLATVPRPPQDALPIMLWRAVDGRLLRRAGRPS
jgi:hypothetical protein